MDTETGNRERHHCYCHCCYFNCNCSCDLYCTMHQAEGKRVDSEVIVLGVSVHCGGCECEIRKYLWSLDGVESVEVDAEKNVVKVKGKLVDPTKMANKLRKKTGKTVQVISPKPKPEEKKKEEEKEKVQKKKEPIEVQLKIYLHCHACLKKVKSCLSVFPGVQSVQLDMEKNLCTLKGTFEPTKIVEYLEESTGKKAEIVKKKEQGDKQHHHQQECLKKNWCDSAYRPCHLDYLTELCSEENANSCIVM